jgi:hypothetical protein
MCSEKIDRKSTDDNFAGNKNCMDINENKNNKRKMLREIAEVKTSNNNAQALM